MGRPKWDNVSKSVYILSGPWTYHCQVHQKAHWLSSLIISLCISFTFSSPSLLSLSSPSSLSRAQKRERKKKKFSKMKKRHKLLQGHLQARIMHGSMKDTNTICKPSNTATFGSFELGAKVCFIPMVVAASS
ncbi:hypothetical protein ACOSP7_006945 [Xanthoceras sorbifolium]